MSQLTADRPSRESADLGRARDVLGRLQQLRDDVRLEAAAQLAEWGPRIERRSFLLSAHNLAA